MNVPFSETKLAQVLRDEWKLFGGTIHGPNVETVCMSEEKYFQFRLNFLMVEPTIPAADVYECGRHLSIVLTDFGKEHLSHGQKLYIHPLPVRQLVEALKPFAEFDLRGGNLGDRDDSQPVYARDKTVLTVGDFKRAKAALKGVL